MSSIELVGNWWGHMDHNEKWHSNEAFAGNRVGMLTKFYNNSGKVIKYITFFYTPYNRVNDIVIDTINRSVSSGKLVGPIEPESISEVCFDNIWVTSVISRVELSKIYVEYMDGTDETILDTDLVKVFSENISYISTRYINGKVNPFSFLFFWEENKFNKNSSFYQKYEKELIKAAEAEKQEEEREKERKKQEEADRAKRAEERKKQEEERKKQEEERKKQELERRQKEAAKQRKKVLISFVAIALIIVVGVVFTTIKNNNEKYDISNVIVEAREFYTDSPIGNTLNISIETVISNNCGFDIEKIEGYLSIYDTNNNVLYEGAFQCEESISSGNGCWWTYEFNLKADSAANATKIATSNSLMFDFVVTDVYFANGTHKSSK